MNERERFLQRWSRRKREIAQPSPEQVPDRGAAELPVPPVPEDATRATTGTTDALTDLTKLPPIESISAATDIRPFLAPGVPVELTRAALRRAWSADPSIRDFVGLAENQWDFTSPGGAPGFGSLPDTEEVRRMLAKVIGDSEPEPARPESAGQADASEPARSVAAQSTPPADETPARAGSLDDGSMVHRNDSDAAPPNEGADEHAAAPRRHGSALPR